MYGALIGMAVTAIAGLINNAVQNNQNKKNTQRQIEGSKELSKFNQGIALENWDKTNAEAQRRQYEKAGLNVGLMYEGKGQGGANSQPGTVGMGDSNPNTFDLAGGAGLGLQAKMQEAQIENIKANTLKQNTETKKISGVDTENLKATTGNILADTKNKELNNAILQYDKEIKAVEADIAKKTEEDVLKQIAAISDKAVGDAISSRAKGEVDEQTYNDKIEQIKQDTTEQQLRMGAIKSNISLQQNQITKIANEINMAKQNNMREWDKMSQTDKEIAIKKMIGDFNTSETAELQRLSGIIGNIINLTNQMPKGEPRKIGF